ncbi:MAG: tetratricopeptide repeat protein [Ignavibacteria bacterium]
MSLIENKEITAPNKEVDKLNLEVKDSLKNNAAEALKLSKEAISLALVSGYSKGLAEAYLGAGIACRLSSNFEAAIGYYDEALNLYTKLNDKKGESRTLNSIANVHYNLSDFKKAIEYYDKCIFVLHNIGDLTFTATVITNRGLSYQQYGDLRASLNNYLESLSLYKSSGEPIHYALYNNLGIVYLEIGRYQEALMYFIEALKKTQAAKNLIDESFTLANIGRTYIYMSEFANAITYLTEAMIIMKKFGNRQAETQVYSNLGKSYKNMRCFPEAVKYYNRALKYYTEIGDKSSVDHTLCEIGELYLELNDFCESKKYFHEALKNSQVSNDIVNILRINTGLAKLYLKFKDSERVSGYLSVAEELAKSTNSYKDLSNIYKIYCESHNAAGKHKEAKEFRNKYVTYFTKLNNIAEENEVQAIMLGHIKVETRNNNKNIFHTPKTEKELNLA